MSRAVGIGNVLQAGVFVGLAAWLRQQFEPAAVIAVVLALLQLAGGVSLFLGRPAWGRRASLVTLVGAAVLVGLYFHGAWFIATRFGSSARTLGLSSLGAVVAAAPWVVAFPLWQVLTGHKTARTSAVALLLIGLGLAGPPLWGAHAQGVAQRWPAQPELKEAAHAAFAVWQGQQTPLVEGVGPATVLLTPWYGGSPGRTARGDGLSLGAATRDALGKLPGAGHTAREALVMDVARERYRGRPLGAPGSTGALSADGGTSPTTRWRPQGVRTVHVLPLWSVPTARLEGRATRFDSALADASGSTALVGGWSPAPELSADAALEAAVEGGRFILRHQAESGRYAYIVAGPSGEEQKGYNYPRHAGVTWYLARLAARTGDAELAEAADRGLAFMIGKTTRDDDGRAWVGDPNRKDGKVWVGTTALAVLAALSRDHEIATTWGAFVASSVDERGQVRGDMTAQTLAFPEQAQNPYGQGQVLLALASLVRAGHEQFRPALERAAAFTAGPYAPLGADRLITLDEHWSCLAALATSDTLGEPAGLDLCRAYLSWRGGDTPQEGSSLHVSVGPAGGLAEAVVAAAVLDPDGPWRARALAFGQLFLDAAYRPEDGPLLGDPTSLTGAFRDSPRGWDVQMDSVQHVGCALLGVEALLRKAEPGNLP